MARYALLGFADTFKLAFEDQYADVRRIGLNELWKYVPESVVTSTGTFPGWTEWLEVHDEDSLGLTRRALGQDAQEVAAHRAWLDRQPPDKIIWMQDRFVGQFPAARAFPLAEIQRRFAPYTSRAKWDYLTSSLALGMAMLLIRGRDEHWQITDADEAATWILLAGIDLVGTGEYQHQRPCLEWFVGFAQALGVDVVIPETSPLLKATHIYGYEQPPEDRAAVSKRRLLARQARLKKQSHDLARDYYKVIGAQMEAHNWLTVIEGAARGVVRLPPNFVDEGPIPTPEQRRLTESLDE